MQVESITIVGGGSSGWMTAALLSKVFPDMQIALIESEKVKRIGVGESTLGHFNRFLRRLDLKDKDWMPKCNATYKTSIAFKNWRDGRNERFQYPFGNFDLFNDYKGTPVTFFELQSVYGDKLYPNDEFARYVNHQTFLAENCRLPMPDEQNNRKVGNFVFDDDTAYHFDADLFGEYLRDEIALPNGVVHIKGDVEQVMKRPDGSISAVITQEGAAVQSDLYIDCTGFKSLLLEQHMGVPFKSFRDKLFNDRAIATQIDYTDINSQLQNYTDCVAHDNGWCWNIPLWNRVGAGYVYSSDYLDDQQALLEFKRYLSDRYSPENVQKCQFKPIKMRHGKHEKAWCKNVIGIGLAYGFLEPLESTGLMTTHESAILLADGLARRHGFISKVDIDTFNFVTNNMMEAMKNFIVMHYTLSQRTDTKYWRDCLDVEMDDGGHLCESDRIAMKLVWAILDSLDGGAFQNSGYTGQMYIAAGMGWRPITEGLYKERASFSGSSNHPDLGECHDMWQKDKKSIMEWVNRQPTHYEYLKKYIYN